MCQLEGWKDWVSKTKLECEQVGQAAVYPMLKPEVLVDRLTRANERLKIIEEIEAEASKVEKLKKRLSLLTGEEKI